MSEAGNRLLRSANQALAYAKGETEGFRVHVPDDVDVKAIRAKLKLTQKAFAERFGFELGTLRHWEQRRRQPEGPARILLRVIEREPEAVRRALS
ncbi:MAG: transcriptional regulator [Deltaproteobacteria bacterium]|nr:transcriptional regulator [Deltaproteobacteria bacterium]